MSTDVDNEGTRDVLVTEFLPLAEKAFAEAGHRELWGVKFPSTQASWTETHHGVLYKFVAAKPTLEEAATQLINTLKWRKEFKPLDAAFKESHSDLYEPLGVITPTPEKRVVTWNLYGAVKDPGTVFADLDAFIRWRVGLMERGIAHLDFSNHQRDTMDQVHDYMDVSFLRMNPAAKKGSQKVVQLFQDYYPELLRAKYFINVPLLMLWVFKFARVTMDAKTADKFHVVHNGTDLAATLGKWVPKAYGGDGTTLQEQSLPRGAPMPLDPKGKDDTTEAVSKPKSTTPAEPTPASEGATSKGGAVGAAAPTDVQGNENTGTDATENKGAASGAAAGVPDAATTEANAQPAEDTKTPESEAVKSGLKDADQKPTAAREAASGSDPQAVSSGGLAEPAKADEVTNAAGAKAAGTTEVSGGLNQEATEKAPAAASKPTKAEA